MHHIGYSKYLRTNPQMHPLRIYTQSITVVSTWNPLMHHHLNEQHKLQGPIAPNLCFGQCISYTYVRTYVHTYIRTYVHTYVHTYVRTYIHIYIYRLYIYGIHAWNPAVHTSMASILLPSDILILHLYFQTYLFLSLNCNSHFFHHVKLKLSPLSH